MDVISPAHKSVCKVKDNLFNVDHLSQYCLSLQISDFDFEICIIDVRNNRCIYVERYEFSELQNTENLFQILDSIYENHHFLMAGYWKSIKLAVKNQKFSLVPKSLFKKKDASGYLKLNYKITEEEEIFYNDLPSLEAVNVFAVNKDIVQWFKNRYPTKEIKLIHSTSPFIESVMRNESSSEEKSMFVSVEKQHAIISIVDSQQLEYTNIFQYETAEDLSYYIMYTMKELGLKPDSSTLTLWGNVDINADIYQTLFKYVRNIQLGEKPRNIDFSYQFDEVDDQKFYSLYNVHLC